jgi:aminopeptidase
VDDDLLQRFARLVVEVGANVQPGQVVGIQCATEHGPVVRAIAAAAYDRGAVFVDPWWYDPAVKRTRLERAAEDTLSFVPAWWGERVLALGAAHGVRISLQPIVPPGFLDGIDPARAGKDGLPRVKEMFQVINDQTTNWTVVPWPTAAWAAVVHPHLEPEQALGRLEEQLVYMLRLDEEDPAAAWKARLQELWDSARRIDAVRFDAIRFEGPGTDLTVGLLPSSRFAFDTPGMRTVDGIEHAPNLPTEEIWTTPDPERVDGVVSATKPLVVGGSEIHGLRVRFEGGRAVQIDADQNADVLRGRVASDEGASRLGEVALVDREGRVGRTDTVFHTTLLDENAASHLALGSGYATGVSSEADAARINTSAVHIDFMIGSNDVAVTGITRDGHDVPLLRGGAWQNMLF